VQLSETSLAIHSAARHKRKNKKNYSSERIKNLKPGIRNDQLRKAKETAAEFWRPRLGGALEE